MIQRVLRAPHWQEGLTGEGRALTPLLYAHVNPYGSFSLDLSTWLDIDGDEVAA